MDFNIYDILGNPPPPKKIKVEWCPFCLEHTATDEAYNLCTVCGETKELTNEGDRK